MGLFDWIRSSYDLGEHFTNTSCQTKDIEEGYSGTMTQYWIAPDGVLYYADYSHTADFVELKEGDEGYDDERKFLNFQWIPSGIHGKVKVHSLTKYVEIYPEQWDGKWEDWPRCRIHFKNGKLIEHEHIKRNSN